MRLSAKLFWRSVGVTCALGTLGCRGDTTGPSARSPLYWQLKLNHHAVTLATIAPYNTIQLIATPLDIAGIPIATTAQPIFTTSDTSITIDSTGLVHVHRSGSNKLNIRVIARLTVGGAAGSTLADTAVVNVVYFSDPAKVPKLDSLLFRPVVGDSARRTVLSKAAGIVTQTFATPVAKTMLGDNIPNVVVRYTSNDTMIAKFAGATTQTVTPVSPGVVLLTAEATVYGKRMLDSMWYTVGYPLGVLCDYGAGQVQNFGHALIAPLPANHLSLGSLTVGQGGAVIWGNSTHGELDDSLDIQFDDTTGIMGLSTQDTIDYIVFPPGSGGNIPPFPAATPKSLFGGLEFGILYDSSASRVRVFTRPGLYHWTSQHRGIAGTVLVVSNDELLSQRGR